MHLGGCNGCTECSPIDWATFESKAGNTRQELENMASINLAGKNLTDEDCRPVAEIIKSSSVLETLYIGITPYTIPIGESSISAEGAKAIGKALAVNEVLKYLNLDGNEIGYEGAKALASALRVNAVGC